MGHDHPEARSEHSQNLWDPGIWMVTSKLSQLIAETKDRGNPELSFKRLNAFGANTIVVW